MSDTTQRAVTASPSLPHICRTTDSLRTPGEPPFLRGPDSVDATV